MDFINPYAIIVAALSTLVTGSIWYNPKVFGTAWMHASGLTEAKLKTGNMLRFLVWLCYLPSYWHLPCQQLSSIKWVLIA
jgi:hypothetical protein